MTHVMIKRGWYDHDFVRRWTNAPLLVRGDDARLMRADEVFAGGDPGQLRGVGRVWLGVPWRTTRPAAGYVRRRETSARLERHV